MTHTPIKKVNATHSSEGEMGQKYLAAGEKIGMRMWVNEPPTTGKSPAQREYETVGYVFNGRAVLHLENEQITLEPGDSWVVPEGLSHYYEIFEPFTAIEATSPPARENNRDRNN